MASQIRRVSPLTPERFISVPMAMAASHSTTQVHTTHFDFYFLAQQKSFPFPAEPDQLHAFIECFAHALLVF
jgi:hypothetical protein